MFSRFALHHICSSHFGTSFFVRKIKYNILLIFWIKRFVIFLHALSVLLLRLSRVISSSRWESERNGRSGSSWIRWSLVLTVMTKLSISKTDQRHVDSQVVKRYGPTGKRILLFAIYIQTRKVDWVQSWKGVEKEREGERGRGSCCDNEITRMTEDT